MFKEPNEDLVVSPESNGEEEPRTRKDQDEPESEKEQRSFVLFTHEQLEVLLKMNRPNFSELVTALKGGASKDAKFQPAKPENFNGARDRKVVDVWFTKMEDYLHAANVGRHSTMELT
jgi:signal recognition particle GTPase